MTNYRPISLLMVFPNNSRKLCTTPAHKQPTDHRTDGFRKGIPTENAAFRQTDCILKSINQKKCMWEGFSVIWQRLLIM